MPPVVIPFLVYGYIHFFMVHNMWDPTSDSLLIFLDPSNILEFLKLAILGPSVNYKAFISLHFWFVYWIIGLYIITPGLKILMDAITPSRAIVTMVALVTLNAYNLYVSQPAIFLPGLNIWLLYYIIGGLIYRIDGSRFKLLALALIPTMYIATIVVTRFNAKHGLPANQYVEGANMIVLAPAIFYVLNSLKVNKFRWLLTFLSERTCGIYLSHIFIYYYFNDMMKAIFSNSIAWALLTGLLVFVLAAILTTVVDFLIIKRVLSRLRFLGSAPADRKA